MSTRREALNVEIGKFKDFVNQFHSLFSQENFDYNVLESQFEQLRNRNNQLKEENLKAEAMVKESMIASEKMLKDANETAKEIRANAIVFYQKANAKFKEVESVLDNAEKKMIQKHLKELEVVA